jgi:hypothetical protein
MKRKILTMLESHNFTILSDEQVANIFVPGWNLISDMGPKCDCVALT